MSNLSNSQSFNYWRTIQIGSKSFALASRFLAKDVRESVWKLYSFCRYADDAVDQCNNQKAQTSWKSLRERTSGVLQSSVNSDPIFAGLRFVMQKHTIPHKYVDDLLEGMRLDTAPDQPSTLTDLEQYCYFVAGTVGAMFCHIMNLRSAPALQYGIDLGCAMQLTNIARDVKEDAAMGRCYLPKDLCAAFGVGKGVMTDNPNISKVVAKILARAEELYTSGDKGLAYLPLRTAFAVAVARSVYAAIGHKVIRLKATAWDRRVYISGVQKVLLLPNALMLVLKSTPKRLQLFWSRFEERWKYDTSQ